LGASIFNQLTYKSGKMSLLLSKMSQRGANPGNFGAMLRLGKESGGND
jgi:hypothetical protein